MNADHHAKLIEEGRKSVAGLLKQDKMRLIFFLLEAKDLAHWVLEVSQGPLWRWMPEIVRDRAKAILDLFEETGVDPDSAYHNFGRFGRKRYYLCPSCGVFTDCQERTQGPGHDAECKGLCTQEIHPTDFFEP